MFQEIDAAIFDLDGTLVDSMWIWKAIDIEYLGRFGISYPEDLQPSIEGMSFSETACYFKERFSIPDSLEQIKADWNAMTREKYRNDVMLKPGALAFIKKWKEKGKLLGIATSNSRELVEEVDNYLQTNLGLNLNQKTAVIPIGNPVEFVGHP